jgi:tRNA-splicing ligase RtcB (3'-phosphate/5'-hydroxy nucleic acid ligase)
MKMETNYITEQPEGGVPIKMWTRGVPVEDEAKQQLANAARLPIIFKHIAAMPDVHLGIGATVGSVIPTLRAIIPAAVGVDIGCGMMACKTTLHANDLPDNLAPLRAAIERAVPHGGGPRSGGRDPGAWENPPETVDQVWAGLVAEFDVLCELHPRIKNTNNRKHLGNAIGTHFIQLAKKDAELHQRNLPDQDLAYFEEGAQYFGDYVRGVGWAQKFAAKNREVMMRNLITTVAKLITKPFESHVEAVNCHHNYAQHERHFGEDVFVTRKGAVSAKRGELGIIPGSMGARSDIVRGLGNAESFESCSHGAGRVMSRTKAKKLFTIDDQIKATQGAECRKDKDVIDEIPMAYKDIDAVMAAQKDLVEVVHTLKQVVCVKG